MKPTLFSLAFIASVLLISTPSYSDEGKPLLKGPYLGQTPPGLTPQPFAPGIITTKGWEVGSAFSLDMNSFYFLRAPYGSEQIESVVYQRKNNRWIETATQGRTRLPFFAPNNKTILMGKQYKERVKTGEWSQVKDFGAPYDKTFIMRMTASLNETYVYDEATRDGNGVLRYSELKNGVRQVPQPLPKTINSGKWNAHPFIAPDESYILWDSERDSGFGDNDIYISFRQNDGSWGDAINLGNTINTAAQEGSPTITPDGKYLFFTRNMGKIESSKFSNVDLFWVDARILETLRPKL